MTEFIKTYLINILWIIVLFFWGKFILKKIVKKIIKKLFFIQNRFVSDKKDETKEKLILEKRAKTIENIIIKIGNVVIYIIIVLMILNFFNVNIMPILAGTGILGLAISFGAQSLIKDFISGLFVLIENQYAIGDKIKIDDKEGEVIKITLRSTILRNEKGSIFYIPNGLIKSVENFSQK